MVKGSSERGEAHCSNGTPQRTLAKACGELQCEVGGIHRQVSFYEQDCMS